MTIEGDNLGLQVKEIAYVQVAGVRWSPVPAQYVSAERSVCGRARVCLCWCVGVCVLTLCPPPHPPRIVCDMAEALLPHSPGGPVELCIGVCSAEFRTLSAQTYSFVVRDTRPRPVCVCVQA